MSVASAKARALIDELGISSHKDLLYLNEMCMYRGVYVREGLLDGAEARLVRSQAEGEVKAIIYVKEDEEYEARTRFSIAHELGHYEIHKNIQAGLSCTPSTPLFWTV